MNGYGSSSGENTRLQVLHWLAANGIDNEYVKVILALALDYGSVVAIGDEEVGQLVREYVIDLLDYIKDTDRFIEERNLPWKAKDYPIMANIGLVWGANNSRYPTFYENEEEDRGQPWNHYWSDEFSNRKMNTEDFNWLFVSVTTLQEMRNWLFSNGYIKNSMADTANSIDSYIYRQLHYNTDNPNEPSRHVYLSVEDKLTPGLRISNPDWQWNYFQTNKKIEGNCEDVFFADFILLKSLNISGLGGLVDCCFWQLKRDPPSEIKLGTTR
jgi:hypothetical protein